MIGTNIFELREFSLQGFTRWLPGAARIHPRGKLERGLETTR